MKKRYVDTTLILTFLALMLLGIIMVYSASAFYAQKYFGDHFYFLKRHLVYLFLGLIGMAVAYSVPYRKLRGYTWIFLFIAAGLLFYSAFIERGRWIHIGPAHFQVVDVAKFALILFFADSLGRKERVMSRYGEGLFPHLFYLALFAGMVLLHPDFSSAIMVVIIGVTMLFVSPVKISHLGYTGAAMVPFMVVPVLISPYKLQRVVAFLKPGDDIQGIGYQVYQSLVSLGHGGITGVGFAGSTQKMFFLPEAHTDFIFAIIGEEWGLIGALVVVFLFGLIALRGLKIAQVAENRFDVYLAVGITTHFAMYAIINMMVTLRLMPATGLPMPFVSYGGTALLFSCIYAGVLLKLANRNLGRPVKKRSAPVRNAPKAHSKSTKQTRKSVYVPPGRGYQRPKK